jgi:hypothetical protein
VEAVFGLTFYMPYLSEGTSHSAEHWASIDSYLARCFALGICVNYALEHYCSGPTAVKPDGCTVAQRAQMIEEVRRVQNHKAIYSWYLADEPVAHKVPVDGLTAAVAAVRAVDSRPITMTLSLGANEFNTSTNASNIHRQLLTACDIVMSDTYPVGLNPRFYRDSNMSLDPGEHVASVGSLTRTLVDGVASISALHDGRHRHVIMVAQSFGSLGNVWDRK